MSANGHGGHGTTYFERLTDANWDVWSEHMKDFIYSKIHGDAAAMFDAAGWDLTDMLVDDGNGNMVQAADPADFDYNNVTGGSAAAIKLKKDLKQEHYTTMAFIKRHLPAGAVTQVATKKLNVPQALRFLRKRFKNDGTVDGRNSLRKMYEAIMLEQFNTVEDFFIAFEALLEDMRKYEMARSDEDNLFRFNEAMGHAWQDVVRVMTSQGKNLQQTAAFLHQ